MKLARPDEIDAHINLKGDRCKDFDSDCEYVRDKVNCWLHDPSQGLCPYLYKEENQ